MHSRCMTCPALEVEWRNGFWARQRKQPRWRCQLGSWHQLTTTWDEAQRIKPSPPQVGRGSVGGWRQCLWGREEEVTNIAFSLEDGAMRRVAILLYVTIGSPPVSVCFVNPAICAGDIHGLGVLLGTALSLAFLAPNPFTEIEKKVKKENKIDIGKTKESSGFPAA